MNEPKVLLVEDNPDDELLTSRALRRCPVASDVLVARSGEEALGLLFTGSEVPRRTALRPVLILLDLKLPGIDGIEVLRRIRGCPETRRIPVIVLTSSRVQADLTACYEAGANSFVQKAVDFDQFQESMRLLTEYWLRVNVPPVPHS